MYLKSKKADTVNDWFTVRQPSEISQRYIGRVHEECFYYQQGLEVCRDRIADHIGKTGTAPADGFASCKPVMDNFYRCTTHDYYGKSIEEMDGRARKYFQNYTNCMFKDLALAGICRAYFDDILRYYIDSQDSPLRKHY